MVDPNQEKIVLVDNDGQPIGTALKLDAHHANTPLHLAFSIYLINPEGKVLVTTRASHKKVWPNVWTNSCCGHPAPGESMTDAIKRRVAYELGITEITDIEVVLPDYRYITTPYNGIIENEVCPVYFGKTSQQPKHNPEEVGDTRWLSWDELYDEAGADTNDVWSWWCKDQLKQLYQNKKNMLQ